MFTVYFSNKQLTTNAGFGLVAHLPCIFDSRPGYHRLGSQFLIDRGLNIWDPISHGSTPASKTPTDQSLRNYASWLCNFLEWSEIRGIDLTHCDYSIIRERYQDEMHKGIWSRDGVPLSPTTINLYAQIACDFLTWSADKGHRGPFHIPFVMTRLKGNKATDSIGHRSTELKVRVGKVKPKKRYLRMPTDEEIEIWLGKIYKKYGYSKGLMCETVLLTAMRRSETAGWRVNTLPENQADWHISNPVAPSKDQRVLLTIKYGTKGPCYGYDHEDKIGPQGDIWIPLKLAERMHEYMKKLRNPALKRWINSAVTEEDQKLRITNSVHLFICDKTGKRITSKDLYRIWTGVDLPFKGWCPHLGRDWWACSVLWKEVNKHETLAKFGINAPDTLLVSTAMDIIRIKIQPQLRHANEKTSMVYVQWVADMLGVNLSINYEAQIE